MNSHLVTVVATDERSRTDISAYLQRSGFDVRLLDRMIRASHPVRSLVWMIDRDGDVSAAAEAIDAWLGASNARCAVVITSRPAAFRAVHEKHELRFVVLPAPVFGWQVVDALRATRAGGAE